MSSSLGHAASSPTKKGSIADLVHQTQPNLPQVNGCNTSNLHCSEQVAHSPTPTIFQPPASVAMQGSSTHQHPCISAGPTQFFSPPRLLRPVPSKHAANYASFTTALLTAAEIEAHWDDSPIMINQVAISNNAPEDEFSEAIQRLWVNVGFRDRVRRNSVIDFGRNYSNYKYFATYSHLMDDKDAYIRIIAYHRSGWRVDARDPLLGNLILVIPRRLNDVSFPPQLRFYALRATDDGQYPHEEHHDIIKAAKDKMTMSRK
jgi:hypothetical protein